jgi:hypothetical protein
MASDALATLDRPRARRPPPGVREHRRVSSRVGAEPAATAHRFVASHNLDRCRPLVRVHHADNRKRDRHYDSRRGFHPATRRCVDALGTEPPDQDRWAGHVGQDAWPYSEDAQAVISQPCNYRDDARHRAEGNLDQQQPEGDRNERGTCRSGM